MIWATNETLEYEIETRSRQNRYVHFRVHNENRFSDTDGMEKFIFLLKMKLRLIEFT